MMASLARGAVRAGREVFRFPLALFFGITKVMKQSIRGIKKTRGRPRTTGSGIQIGTRWHEPELAAIDVWRREQELPGRSEAIRQLVKLALSSQPARRSKGSTDARGTRRSQSKRMAGDAIPDEVKKAQQRHSIKMPGQGGRK